MKELEDLENIMDRAHDAGKRIGFEKGYVVGVAQGRAEAYPNAALIGYQSHHMDMATAMEELETEDPAVSRYFIRLLARLERIETQRQKTKDFST